MRVGRIRVNWTEEEQDFLRQHGARFSRRTLQKELNLRFGKDRSYQAVKFQCFALKVKSEAFHRPSGVARKWTSDDDLLLRESLGRKSVAEIAAGLGRTYCSVVARGKCLKIMCRQVHERMSVNDAIKKLMVSRQTFLAGAKRIGVEIPFVTRTRREISDETFEKIRVHLEGRKRLPKLRVARVCPVVRVPVPVRVRKPKPEPTIEPMPVPEPEPPVREPERPARRLELIRKRTVCMKARSYFQKMRQYNATISQVEVMRKAGAKAAISGGRVVRSMDMDVIDEAARASGYEQRINKGVVIYSLLTKTDRQL